MKTTDIVLNIGVILFFAVFHVVNFIMAAVVMFTACFIIFVHDLFDNKEKPVSKKVEKGKSKPEKKGKK